MKKLDSLNNAVAAESSERAARRAERARARRAEQTNGDVSTTEAGVVITEQVLAEINDEETLQKLVRRLVSSFIKTVLIFFWLGMASPSFHIMDDWDLLFNAQIAYLLDKFRQINNTVHFFEQVNLNSIIIAQGG